MKPETIPDKESNSPLAGELARPRAVEFAAVILLITPFLDILFAHKYGIAIFDYFGWGLIFFAGVSLIIRHKLAWLIGVGLCLVFTLWTIINIFTQRAAEDPILNSSRILDCLLVSFIVATVAYFFRYPYINRRQRWLAPTAHRFQIPLTVVLNGKIEAKLENISYTGACVLLPMAQSLFSKAQVLTVNIPEINDVSLRAEVVQASAGTLRLSFHRDSSDEKEQIRQWLAIQEIKKV